MSFIRINNNNLNPDDISNIQYSDYNLPEEWGNGTRKADAPTTLRQAYVYMKSRDENGYAQSFTLYGTDAEQLEAYMNTYAAKRITGDVQIAGFYESFGQMASTPNEENPELKLIREIAEKRDLSQPFNENELKLLNDVELGYYTGIIYERVRTEISADLMDICNRRHLVQAEEYKRIYVSGYGANASVKVDNQLVYSDERSLARLGTWIQQVKKLAEEVRAAIIKEAEDRKQSSRDNLIHALVSKENKQTMPFGDDDDISF